VNNQRAHLRRSDLVISPSFATPTRKQLQDLVCARAGQFSLAALLATLSTLGYQESQIELRSNITSLHQPALIASIEFQDSLRVIVTLNYGLLATQSPLPGYVLEYIEKQSQTTLADFLQFVAHHLLRQFASGQRALLPACSHSRTARNVLYLLGRKSTSTIHWLFAQVFPELEVHVGSGQQCVSIKSLGVMLGFSCFGDGSSFGSQSSVQIPRVTITLLAEEPLSPLGRHWYFEAQRRLKQWVLPLLVDQQLYLSVILLVRNSTGWLCVGGQRQLGVEPIRDTTFPVAAVVRRVPLFEGEVTEMRCAGLLLDGAD
jgi:hypothetical protein